MRCMLLSEISYCNSRGIAAHNAKIVQPSDNQGQIEQSLTTSELNFRGQLNNSVE